MSTLSWLNAVDEDAVLTQAKALDDQNKRFQGQANPDLANRIAQIYRQNPWMKPAEILALAKGNASDNTVALASDLSARKVAERTDLAQPKGWFRRNVYDKLKTATRWTFSALNFTPELTQNVASQLFSPNDPTGFDGWFKSTSLGTMLANSDEAGEGFFLGEKAAEKQSERARRFRGTINGSAFTIGRGAADIVFTPGSKEYNLLSGLIDASVQIYADPTIIGGELAGAAKLARAIPGISKADELAAVAKIAERGMAGLSQAEEIAWDASKFRRFMSSNSGAKRLVAALKDNDDPFDILSRLFDYKIEPEQAVRLAEAKTIEQVQAIIGESADRMSRAGRSLIPEDIADIPGATRAEWVKERIPGYNSWRKSRLLTEVPETVLVNGSSADRANAIKSYANYLDTIGVKTDSVEGRNFMRQAVVAYSTKSTPEVKSVQELFEQTVTRVLTDPIVDEATGRILGYNGLNPKMVSTVFAKAKQAIEETRRYFIDAAGNPTDAGFIKSLIDNGYIDLPADINPKSIDQLRLNGPGSIVELLDNVVVLPDVRAMRRITSNPFMRRVFSRPDGDPRGLIAATEFIQNEIWKPITLATGGYIVRNMFDAQIRLATIGKAGFFNHPLDYIQYIMHRKAPATIRGREFDDFITKQVNNWDEETDFFAANQNFGLRRNLEDPIQETLKAQRNGSFKTYNRTAERDEWLRALQGEYEQIIKDPIMNAVAKGIGTDSIVAYLRENPKGQRALDDLTRYLQGGVHVVDENGYSRILDVPVVDDNVLAQWIERLAASRVNLKSGNLDDIRIVLGYRRVPIGDTFTRRVDEIVDEIIDGPRERPGRGSIVRFGDREAVVIDASNDRVWTLQELSKNDVINTPEGKAELAEYLKARASDPTVNSRLPQNVKGPEYNIQRDGQRPAVQAFLNMKDRAVDKFFVGLYGKGQQFLEKSPLFRQFYYEGVARNADLLSQDEAARLISTIDAQAASLGITPENFVGSRKLYDELLNKLDEADGTGTIAQLDDYAQLTAFQATKEALYNAQSRNNLEDILRIAVPFGVAYREVLSTYIRFAIENPARIRRAQLIYNGATNFDPDNDGQGFFYKDPTTGNNMFNFPLSGQFAKLLTGLDAPLQAPVKRLSLGLQVIPSVGPVVQVAASKLLPDTPKTDAIAEILLPYGRKEGIQFVPGWLSKLNSAIEANPGKLESIYANTYMETVRALSATGEYDLSDELEKQRLFDDAKSKAQILTGFRALSQFLGPTSATPEFIVSTKDGDVMASALTKAFYDLQQENYDTAVQRFLEIFGDDAFAYVSSKTKSTTPGLLATTAFGDWERTNSDLIRTYPEVAAFFAPGGNDFDFQVWERQIRTGKRERLTEKEIIDLAQYRIGSSLYRDLKAQIGPYPSRAESQWLADARVAIHKKYPGFPPVAVFTVNKQKILIEKLGQAVNDPRLEGNAVADAAREYLSYRDQAIAEMQAAGYRDLSSKAATDLRNWLFSIGSALATAYPDFQRLWDQELSSEVDQ